jgi:hypothetical protein
MLLTSSAFAQVRVEVVAPPPPRVYVSAPPPPAVVVGAPTVRFEAPPPLVEVQPGVQVVEDCDDEVFFSAGWYWHPGPNGVWYRARSWRGGWVAAPPRVVPAAIVRMPRGEYRHYRRDERREERHADREERHDERRADREERHDERRADREERHEEHRIEKNERRADKEQRHEEHHGRR